MWRHDSRELFYRASDGTLMAVPMGTGSDFTAGAPIPLFKPRAAIGDWVGHVLRRRARWSFPDQHFRGTDVTAGHRGGELEGRPIGRSGSS